MTKRLKVLQLTTSLMVGGAERVVLTLAEHIDKRHFEMHVCSLMVFQGNALRPAFERQGIPVYVVGAKRFYTPGAVQAVARYVRANNIDVIHTHTLDADVVGHFVGRLTGCPVVTTQHSIPFEHERQSILRRTLERVTLQRMARNLIAVSNSVRDAFVEQWGIEPSSIRTIYNAVPMEHLLAIPLESADSDEQREPTITTVGRLVAVKAQHVLIEAASIVLAQGHRVRFMIVGHGPREAMLKAQAQQLNIADRIIFTGLRHDVPSLLAASDVFVLTSLWEGLPLTAVEALAAARPVILSRAGGNPEVIEEGVSGLLVPPGDPVALASALTTMLNDRRMRLTLGQAARERAAIVFSMDTFVNQHEAVYAALADARKRPGRNIA
jgi:glycosyltransferase involved in cell wall biosynthesis